MKKVYKFKNLIAFLRFFGSLGGNSDVHVSVFLKDEKGERWTLSSRLTVPENRQLTRLFPYTSSDVPLMVEFVWVTEFQSVHCNMFQEPLNSHLHGEQINGGTYRFPTYDDLARYNIKLNTMPPESWKREAKHRLDHAFVSYFPANFDDLLAQYLREGKITEVEI